MNRFAIKRFLAAGLPIAALGILPACVKVHVDALEVKPITLNVNINYVDQQLDDYFAYQKANPPTTAPGANITAPAADTVAPANAANPGTMP